MIARGAIDHPWIFREAKELLNEKNINTVSTDERIYTALRHLRYSLEIKEPKAAIIPFRKYYAGYLKGLNNSKEIRQELYKQIEYAPIENILLEYLRRLKHYQQMENII